jgi:hypothetical protein
LQPILARTATFIERAALEVDSVGPVLADLDREIEALDRSAFDLDASVLADLAGADSMPEPPYDLAQLALLLDRPEMLPSGYDSQALDSNQWAVRTDRGGVQARVTSDRELYEENLEDYELWTWGSRVFPRVDLARDDVRASDYPSSLRRLLDT